MTEKIKKLLDIINSLTKANFYGRLEITFSAGKIIVIKKEESIKLD